MKKLSNGMQNSLKIMKIRKILIRCHKDFKNVNKDKYGEIKPVISVADKAALKVKMDKIATVKDANKVLKTTIIKNAEAVKVELKRIEDSKIVLDPVVKTEADSVLLAVKDATTKNSLCKTSSYTSSSSYCCSTCSTIVDPTVPVVPVEKTYLEKLNERLDNVFEKYTDKEHRVNYFRN